jgi:hypothetical protein
MAKKKIPAGITAKIYLGSTKATAEQKARLKARIESHLITWVRSELGKKSLPQINVPDHIGPPPPGDGGNGGDGNG